MKPFQYAIALTGSIATGKSSAVKILKELGLFFIDADKIAHKILDEQHSQIAKMFGLQYLIGERVNRKALGQHIFSNPQDKKRLERLLHPLIYIEIERVAKEKDKLKQPYIIDIPLFFETNRYPIETTIVVYTPKEKQLKRLMSRDGFSNIEAQNRINAQISIEEKILKATYIIDNSGDLKALQQECVRVRDKILTKAGDA
jgi:dephospho-CoA kinase